MNGGKIEVWVFEFDAPHPPYPLLLKEKGENMACSMIIVVRFISIILEIILLKEL